MRNLLILMVSIFLSGTAWAEGQTAPLPDPLRGMTLAPSSSRDTAVFAGGCFWGVQWVFQHVKGVISATSGYAGGAAKDAEYETVSTGTTGHAESVRVVYDPAKVSYGQLLKIYFSVAHNPMQLNRQGPDWGTQYRSEIFTLNDEQKGIAKAYIGQLGDAGVYPDPIVTRVEALKGFYPAEEHHQNFAEEHPNYPYIVFNDRPKLEHLKQQFSEWYR